MNWLAVIVAGLATYLSRAGFIAFGAEISLPPIVESALRFAAPAAFAAISLPIVLGGDGFAEIGEDIPRILAATLAVSVVWKFRNIGLSLFAGMATLWLLSWLL